MASGWQAKLTKFPVKETVRKKSNSFFLKKKVASRAGSKEGRRKKKVRGAMWLAAQSHRTSLTFLLFLFHFIGFVNPHTHHHLNLPRRRRAMRARAPVVCLLCSQCLRSCLSMTAVAPREKKNPDYTLVSSKARLHQKKKDRFGSKAGAFCAH